MGRCFPNWSGMAWVLRARRAELTHTSGSARSLNLEPGPDAVAGVRIEFLTPTELKSNGVIVERPEFPILFARIRDRISTLRAMYGSGPLPIDFAALGERACAVKMTRCDVTLIEAERRSSRTGQTHSLGGFIGSAEYEGDLAEFLPLSGSRTMDRRGQADRVGKGRNYCGVLGSTPLSP